MCGTQDSRVRRTSYSIANDNCQGRSSGHSSAGRVRRSDYLDRRALQCRRFNHHTRRDHLGNRRGHPFPRRKQFFGRHNLQGRERRLVSGPQHRGGLRVYRPGAARSGRRNGNVTPDSIYFTEFAEGRYSADIRNCTPWSGVGVGK